MATRRASSRLGNNVHKDDENAPGLTGAGAGKRLLQGGKQALGGLKTSKSTNSVSAEAGLANPRKRILNDRTNTSKAASTVDASNGDGMKRPTLARKASNLSRPTTRASGKEDGDAMAVDDQKRPIKGIRKTASGVAGPSKLAGAASSKAGSTSTSDGGAVRKGLAVKKGANNGAVAAKATASTKAGGLTKRPTAVSKKLVVQNDEEDEVDEGPLAKRLRTSEPDHVPADEDDEAPVGEVARPQKAEEKVRPLKEGEEGWEDLDAGDEDDPLMVAEYVVEVYEYMRELELRTLPDSDYMSRQDELTWKMRGILVDWLVEVHTKFRLLPETIFLAANLVDRFLSLRVVSLLKFQLVGVTALFVAAKYEEVVCPSVNNFLFMTDGGYEVDEMLRAERYLLEMLEFNLSYPNPLNFLRRISKADKYDIQSRTFAKYFMEISIVEHRLLATPPSLVAAAATWFSRKVLDRGDWDPNLVHYSGYSQREVLPAAQIMLDYVLRSGVAEAPEHVNFHKKYASKKFYKCSEIVREWAATRYMEKTATGYDFFRFEEWDD